MKFFRVVPFSDDELDCLLWQTNGLINYHMRTETVTITLKTLLLWVEGSGQRDKASPPKYR